jgi:hypothetical protein
MKKLVLLLSFLSLLLNSCSKQDLENKVQIRINNQTGRNLTDISVFSQSSFSSLAANVEKKYGNVANGKTSKYLVHGFVTYYPFYKFNMQGAGILKTGMLRCGMGIGYLDPGKYSLLIEGDYNSPYIRFVKD